MTHSCQLTIPLIYVPYSVVCFAPLHSALEFMWSQIRWFKVTQKESKGNKKKPHMNEE